MNTDSQPVVYSKINPLVTNYLVNSGFTFEINMNFGEHLKLEMEKAGIRAAELSRRSGVSKQYVGKILNNTKHSTTEAPPKPEPETVEKLAKGLGWNVDEALLAAGYAPKIKTSHFHAVDGIYLEFYGGIPFNLPEIFEICEFIKFKLANRKNKNALYNTFEELDRAESSKEIESGLDSGVSLNSTSKQKIKKGNPEEFIDEKRESKVA